jgi:aminopeptidase YwaD
MLRPIVVLFYFMAIISYSQDMAYTRSIIQKLSSAPFHGRGYVKNGCNVAGKFLENEFKQIGLQTLDQKSFKQAFSFPVNTFPKQVRLSVNGEELIAGKDFILSSSSTSFNNQVELWMDDAKSSFKNDEKQVQIKFEKKLTFSVSQAQSELTEFIVLQDSNKTWQKAKSITIKARVDAKFIPKYSVFNLVGQINGTSNVDSVIVFSAHYDHLGHLGRTVFFPGANDNASGVSMLLNLAKAIKKNPLKYKVVFILFAGEEAGLVGSKFFTLQPLLALNKIKFLVNLDLNGTGDDGATVVNSTIYKDQFELLNQINLSQHFLPVLKTRGKAANSDHYWFTEKGVPAFFIYTMGGIKAYHDIYDKAETLPLTKYSELYQLLMQFAQQL